jgi:hypothetical protein
MFAVTSTIIDTTPKSKITHITNGQKNIIDFDFDSENNNFSITVCFKKLEESELDNIANLLNKFSDQILRCMHSNQVMHHVIDFNGQITDPESFLIMLHASFTSELKMNIFSELYKNICNYIKTIENIAYPGFSYNNEDENDEEDEEDEEDEDEDDEDEDEDDDDYDPKDTISTEIHFLDNGKKYKKRAQEQPSKKLKKHKELLRRRLMNDQ